MDSLAELGLVRMHKTDLQIPGYNTVIECERISPIIPPPMWTSSMLREAALSLCEINKELLLRGLVIWDLKGMANMTFSAQHGPVFMDIGAIHRIDEIENGVLSTSINSLFEQIASSFYAPLWLAHSALGRGRLVRQFLEYYRKGPMSSELSKAMLRRLTIGWRALPGALRARALLGSRQYTRFYEVIMHEIRDWGCDGISEAYADPCEPSEGQSVRRSIGEIVRIIGDRLGNLKGKTVFDLCPQEKVGTGIADRYAANAYLLTKDSTIAEQYWGLRKKKNKPVLPVVCDIWDRSFHNCCDLEESCDVVCLLPSIIDAAMNDKVPIDFIGRVTSSLTRNIAVVGIRNTGTQREYPFFVSPAQPSDNVLDFVRQAFRKYFRKQEVVNLSDTPGTSILILHK